MSHPKERRKYLNWAEDGSSPNMSKLGGIRALLPGLGRENRAVRELVFQDVTKGRHGLKAIDGGAPFQGV